MGDWSTTVADQHYGTAFFAATPSNTAHTKGAWGGYVGAQKGCGLVIRLSYAQSHSTARTIIADIGIGESGSQVVLIPNFTFTPPNGGSPSCRAHECETYFPITIPAEKLWVRTQASMTSHGGCYIYPSVVGGGTPAFGSVCTTYGCNTGTSLGVAVTASSTENVSGAWVEITPSTSKRIRALVVAVNGGTTALTSFTDQWVNYDVGVGPSGSELVLISPAESGGSSSYTGIHVPLFMGPFNVDIPAGTRISIRMRAQWTSSAQRVRYFTIYGIS